MAETVRKIAIPHVESHEQREMREAALEVADAILPVLNQSLDEAFADLLDSAPFDPEDT